MSKNTIIVSACLLGIKTRYNGEVSLNPEVMEAIKDKKIVPVCPEQLGGLSTPRPRAEIRSLDGSKVIAGKLKVMDENGADVTAAFLKGAEEVLKIAGITGAKEAYLKEKSPSCGVNSINRNGISVKGSGVTAALLKKEGIKVQGF